jgi:hypothetical protein
MEGTTVCTAVINLMRAKLSAPGQAYVALSRARSLKVLRLEEPDCGKLTTTNTVNIKEDGNIANFSKIQ